MVGKGGPTAVFFKVDRTMTGPTGSWSPHQTLGEVGRAPAGVSLKREVPSGWSLVVNRETSHTARRG